MRAGLPVVASNVGGITEAVVDETNGYLFAPSDVEQLKEKLKRLILKPQAAVGDGPGRPGAIFKIFYS
jgi:glycosyltransferase involved in cell wall biosynthesis